jgi:outer membrane protein OmpA-like peptidoglycan-associated protein
MQTLCGGGGRLYRLFATVVGAGGISLGWSLSIAILSNMKKTALPLIAALLLCSGCNMPSLDLGLLGGGTDDVRTLDTGGPGLQGQLAQEYQNLAVLETDFKNDPAAAARYTEKAERAADGDDVWPDSPESVTTLPADAFNDLADAYNMVLDARKSMDSTENAPLLALAQTRYDCWLMRTADGRDEADISICRDMAVKALGLLTVPQGTVKTFAVYFPASDGITFDPESLDTIAEAAAAYEEKPYWEVLLTGHAAAKSSKREQTKNLSMRRAVAVRNALAQQGIDPEKVTIVAHTEKDDTESGRRVDITFAPSYMMKDGPVLESLEMMGGD